MHRSASLIALVLACLAGCSTPRHTNTLIFGTSTRLALDVSQEPSGSLGATLGYKRHEAVFMPLLANETADGTPTQCNDDDCRSFVGQSGAGGGAAGPGARDTYSVLATFSGDMAGSARDANAKAQVAQYFATGLAARLLAQMGGAAAVSSGASAPAPAAIQASQGVLTQASQLREVAIRLTRPDGKVDPAVLSAVLGKAPASGLSATIQNNLRLAETRADVEGYLKTLTPETTEALFKSF